VRRLDGEGDWVDNSKKSIMLLHFCCAPPRARLHKQLLASPAGPKTVSNESGVQCMGREGREREGVKECVRGVKWTRCAATGA